MEGEAKKSNGTANDHANIGTKVEIRKIQSFELRKYEEEPDVNHFDFRDFFQKPYITTWIGCWLVFLGSLLLLLSTLFLEDWHDKKNAWTSFWAVTIIWFGSVFFFVASFINQPILVNLGGFVLMIGLGFFVAYFAWYLKDIATELIVDDPEKFDDHKESRSALSITAVCIVIVSIVLFAAKGFQRFVKPYFGPVNYFLYGAIFFGGGAFSYLLASIVDAKNVDDDKFGPHSHTDKFGAFMLTGGSFMMLLASSRSYYCLDMLIVYNFPSVTTLDCSPIIAVFLTFISGVGVIGGYLLVVAILLTSKDSRLEFVTAASALIAVTYLSQIIVFSQMVKVKLGLIFTNLLNAFSMAVYALGIGLQIHIQKGDDQGRYQYPGDFLCGSTALGMLTSIVGFCLSVNYGSPGLLVPGNFYILYYCLLFGSYFSLFLSELTKSSDIANSCNIACQGAQEFGYVLMFHSHLLQFFYFVIVADVSFIEYGKVKFFDLLLKWFTPTEISSQEQHTETKAAFLRTLTMRQNEMFHNSFRGSANMGDDTLLDEIEEETIDFLETDAFVVGCGPSGLTLVNELASRGVNVIAADCRSNVIPDSRFFSLSCATVEGLKRLGVKDTIIEKSIPEYFGHGTMALTGFTHPNSKVIAKSLGPSRAIQRTLGHKLSLTAASRCLSSKWAEEMGQRCMQSVQEEVLKQKAESYSNTKLLYGWEVLSFCASKNEHVCVKLKNVLTNEIRYAKSKYLVGCDGPSSVVSKLLHAKFDGFVNLGQTRTIHFKSPGLLDIVRGKYGDCLQYQIARPGFGVGFFVLNDFDKNLWTFFLMGLLDGRVPRQLSKDDMKVVLKEFIGPDIEFEVASDGAWFWNMFFARRFVYGNVMLCGDSAHSWPPFGGLGGNAGYADAQNLGWKLAAVIQGWGNQSMLESYDLERREAGLRTIMNVLNFAPDRSQILRLAQVVQYSYFIWTATLRWLFGTSGVHPGNHMISEGIVLGNRYRSHVIVPNAENEVDPVESTVSRFNPCIVNGGRLPHIILSDNQSINSYISMSGYTLLVIDANIQVEDCLTSIASSELTNRNIVEPVVRELDLYFRQRKIPLAIVNILPLLQSITAKEELFLKNLYLKQRLILVRPDLYVSWQVKRHVGVISTLDLLKVAQIACSEMFDENQIKKSMNTSTWLTERFISNIQGYKAMHINAVYVENEDKAAVIEMLAAKNAKKEKLKQANAQQEQQQQEIKLTTKQDVEVTVLFS